MQDLTGISTVRAEVVWLSKWKAVVMTAPFFYISFMAIIYWSIWDNVSSLYQHSLQFRVQERDFVFWCAWLTVYTELTLGYLFQSQEVTTPAANEKGEPVSPFHDIPLYADETKTILNMVVEIPRWTNHKMEISKDEDLNPIKQDVKKGNVRFVKNCFPHHGYIWNYGALPQTWEDNEYTDPNTNTKGDNDPLDVCEIGQTVHKRGSVIQVKVLGVMCLVDEGETDWKIFCIDVNDPLAEKLNDIDDIDKHMPGFIAATREWFTIYKIPDGKPANNFAFKGEAKDKKFAMEVIEETNGQWQKLIANECKGDICCKNVCVASSPFRIEKEEAKAIVEKSDGVGASGPVPDDVDKWHYIPDPKSAL